MLCSLARRYAIALIILVVFSLVIGIQVYPAYSQENPGIIIPAGDSAALVRAIEQANQAGTETPLNVYLQAGQYILYAANEVNKPTLPTITGALNLFGQNTLLLLYSETASPAQVTIALGARVELHRLQFLVASGTGRAVINHGTLRIYDSQFGSLDREVLPGVGEGGGIENYGDLNVERTTFARNQYLSNNTEGGAIYNSGQMAVVCTRFLEGLSSRGGAVFNTGNAIITKSAFKDNIANGGGAIFNEGGEVDAGGSWWANSTPVVDSLYQGRDTISEDVAIMPVAASDPTLEAECDPDQTIIEPHAITSEQRNDTNVVYNSNTGGIADSPIFISGYPSNATVDAITFCWNIDANFDIGDTPFWYTRARLSRDNPSAWQSLVQYPSRTGDDEWFVDGYDHTSNECKTLNQPAIGLPVNGTWWLKISTYSPTESGRIDWWSIQITYSVPFTVTGTTLLINNSTTPASVDYNSKVNISGTITGTGTGEIKYQLQKALQGTANWTAYDGMIYTVQMTNGATVPLSHSNVLMMYIGTYDFRFRVTTPSAPSQTNSTARLTIRGTANTPNTPTGTANGFTGTAYTYNTNDSKCQDGQPAEYQFNWGPTKSAWLDISQDPASYTWNTPGTYYVTVQARCKYYTSGLSGTSGALTVNMVEPFTVTGTTMLINGSANPSPVPWGQSVVLGGYASGTGSGTVAYNWEWRYSGTSQWRFGGNSASTMSPTTHTAPLGYTVLAPAIGDLEFRYWVTSPSSPNQSTSTAFLTVSGTASQPATLTGESYVRVGQAYTYRTSGATCPDNGQVRYQFAYNLGSNVIPRSWGNPVSSTTEVSDTYTWPVAGEYLEVWVRAKCAYLNNGPESGFKMLGVKAVDIRSVTARINGSTSPGTVNYGNVTLSGTIDATGTGAVNYTWQFRRSGQTNWQIVSTRTVNLNNSTPLTTETHQPINIGSLEYRVVISSPAPDVVSNTINITVAASPTMPNRPSGPSGGDKGTSYLFSTGGSTCPNSSVEYQFYWGDNTSPSDWSTTTSAPHIWSDTGTFIITAWARCRDYPSGITGPSQDASIVIKEPPFIQLATATINGSTSPQPVALGASITLAGHVMGTGNTSINYYWQYRNVPNGSFTNMGNLRTILMIDGNGDILPEEVTPSGSGQWEYRLFVLASPSNVYSTPVAILVVNITTPTAIHGSPTGSVGESMSFATEGSACSEGGYVEYRFDWNDGSPFSNWADVMTSHYHVWSVAGVYNIRSQSRCVAYPHITSAWSQPKTITITSSGTAPGTVTQTGPSNNITLRTPIFTWQKEANSTSYDIQVVRNDVTVIHAQNYSGAVICGASTCSIAPALDLDSDYYSWWVRGVNTGGNGPWSGQGFAVTILPGLVTQTAPIGAYNGRTPTFTWNRERDSHEYGIWIGQGSTTLHLVYIQASTYCNATTCSYTPPLDLSSNYYVWWVGGYSLGGGGSWTGTGFHTTVLPGLLTQTAPIGPYDGRTPTFTWNRDRDAHEYGIWIGQGSTTTHLAYIQASTHCNTTTCSYTPPLDLSSGYYTWWVGGYSLGGGGPWNGNGFQITVVPAAIVQLGPQGTISQSNPPFTWQRDRDAIEYGILIAQGGMSVHQATVQANTVCPSQTPGSTCTYIPALNLTPDGYSWWIGGYSLGGGGPWGSMNFTIGSSGNTSRIAFSSKRDGNWNIYVMGADGNNLIALTNNTANDGEPAWSPDGTKLVFSSDRDGNSEIYTMNADGSDVRRLTNHPATDYSPSWSPDGSRIIFGSDRDNNWELYTMDPNGNSIVRLTTTSQWEGYARYSPDGARIVYSVDVEGQGIDIWVMNADGTGQQNLTNRPYLDDVNPSWSPDGQTIVYSARTDNRWDIILMNPNGSNKRNLTNSGYSNWNPDWSPDGQRIVFESIRNSNTDIYVIDVGGTNETRLTTHAADDAAPAWSPN